MESDQTRKPVLWALSKNSGSGFQAPLFKALGHFGGALAVSAKSSPVTKMAHESGRLLYTPATATSLATGAAFGVKGLLDRQQLTKRIRARASVVHVTMGSPWDAFYLGAARRAGRPIIITLHDAERHPGEEGSLFDRLEPYIVRQADYVATLSRHVYSSYQASGRFDRPAFLVEDGLLTRSEEACEPRTCPDNRPLRLLFLGRILKYKGLDLALDALLSLQDKGLKFELIIAGSGDLTGYQSAIEKIECRQVINRWISDFEVEQILRQSDVMLLPYIEASQSGVALDAQWAALPSVSTRVGALPKQLRENHDSLFVDEVSATAIAEKIESLLVTPNLYNRLSHGAYESYQLKGLERVAGQWNQLYQEVLARWPKT